MFFGFVGMILCLAAYFLKSKDKVNDLVWHALNGAGAMLCLAYAVSTFALPFIILNATWALISLKGITEYFYKTSNDLSEKQTTIGG